MSSHPGGYEDALGALTLICGAALLVPFLSNRHLFPIAQRSPVLSAISNAAHTVVVSTWLFQRSHPEFPLVAGKIINQICFGWIVVGFFVRALGLYLEAGLAKERVANKQDGWFIRHRNWRSRKFLMRLTLGLVFVHVIMMFYQIGSHPEDNLTSARGHEMRTEDFITTSVIVCYFFSYIVFAFLLAKVEDGFYYKYELGLVGAGMVLTTALGPMQSNLGLPCAIASCDIFILWVGWLWMITCCVIFPLAIAMRDAHFSWTACFQPGFWLRKRVTRGTLVASRSSRPSGADKHGQGEFPSFHSPQEAALEEARRRLSDERILRLKHVPLATFLTFPAGREAFRRFTVREFSVENLIFVEVVKELHGKATVTKADCQEIFDKFIADSAPNQVNLPSGTATQILAQIKEAEPGASLHSIFDEASMHILKLLQRDAFKRFQNTPEWQQCVAVFDTLPKPAVETSTASTVEAASTKGVDPLQKDASTERESTKAADHVLDVSAVERGSAMERCSTPEERGEEV